MANLPPLQTVRQVGLQNPPNNDDLSREDWDLTDRNLPKLGNIPKTLIRDVLMYKNVNCLQVSLLSDPRIPSPWRRLLTGGRNGSFASVGAEMANRVVIAGFLEYTSMESRIQIAEGTDEVEQRSGHLAHRMSIPMRDRCSHPPQYPCVWAAVLAAEFILGKQDRERMSKSWLKGR